MRAARKQVKLRGSCNTKRGGRESMRVGVHDSDSTQQRPPQSRVSVSLASSGGLPFPSACSLHIIVMKPFGAIEGT